MQLIWFSRIFALFLLIFCCFRMVSMVIRKVSCGKLRLPSPLAWHLRAAYPCNCGACSKIMAELDFLKS